MSEILNKIFCVTMPNGEKWTVPVIVIAKNRAACYAEEFGNSVARSLSEDTIPLFESDDNAITDWASNNMNWSDVKLDATRVKYSDGYDYEEEWLRGKKEIITLDSMIRALKGEK